MMSPFGQSHMTPYRPSDSRSILHAWLRPYLHPYLGADQTDQQSMGVLLSSIIPQLLRASDIHLKLLSNIHLLQIETALFFEESFYNEEGRVDIR